MGEIPKAGWLSPVMKFIVCGSVVLLANGCYRSSFQERNGLELQRVPIDRNQPTSAVRWSTFWGLKQDIWAPTACAATDEHGACTKQVPLCEKGAGQVSAGTVWYSVPIVVVSLGIAMPMKMTAYCATDRAVPGPPPIGP